MSNSLQNIYHLRTVSLTSAKSCMICYKPSSSVLITPDNKDFFYVCKGHLQDRGFASPIVDEAVEAEKKKQAELEREKDAVKKEYEEKIKKKAGKKAGKDVKDDEKKDDKEKGEGKDEKADETTTTETNASTTTADDTPRIYALHRSIFQMRLNRIREAEIAKRNRERLANPSTFPSVPTGNP